MCLRNWKHWLTCGVVGTATSWAAIATAQQDVLIPARAGEFNVQPLFLTQQPNDADVLFVVDSGQATDEKATAEEKAVEEAARNEYWLGVQISALPEVVKQQLAVDHGLAVEDVLADSPAAKAEVKKFDILVKAGDTPLKELSDLIKAVEASQGKEITLSVVRGGKDMSIRVTATKKPASEAKTVRVWAQSPEIREEIKRLEEALEKLKGKDGVGLWFARPGVVAPRVDVKVPAFVRDLKAEFPKDLKVQINKQGDQPTKIHVERGDKSWDVTEEKLSDLPDDILPHVQRMLGRMIGPSMAATATRAVRVSPEGKVEGELKFTPAPPAPPAPPAAPRRGAPPVPPAAPVAPQAGRSFSYRLERSDDVSEPKLDAILKEVKQLRKEVEELRSKSPSDSRK
jgi:membrane-associated protease RseP (regulator of RpoE activity)